MKTDSSGPRGSTGQWMAFGGLLLLALGIGCASRRAVLPHHGLLILHWIEQPSSHGPSKTAAPADVVRFDKFLSYEKSQKKSFAAARDCLREGDVIAYRMTRNEARLDVLKGKLNSLGYDLLEYGHLGIIVQAPKEPGQPDNSATLRIFSSESFIGPNTREDLGTLAKHNWDAYRLNQWDRVDIARLHEFVRLVEERAGHWYGYDFSGMFGLWNSNLTPATPRAIGYDYICSTVVLAALYYSGVQLDAVRNYGYLDVCTPLQVVRSPGRITNPPHVTFTTTDAPTSRMITLPGKTVAK